MKGIGDLMKQAQEMQDKLADMQSELAKLEVTGEAGAGLVKVTLNGQREAVRVKIDPTLRDEGLDMLEDLITAAINDAERRAERLQQEHMSGLTAGMGLPPGFKLPF